MRKRNNVSNGRRCLTVISALLLGVFQLSWSAGASAAPPTRPETPDGWFHVYPLDAHTYAISEPKYWQENVSYLLIGKHRALLFDTGPGLYSIKAVVDKLTSLPVTVTPSHLHFDHVGDLEEFSDVELIDKPELRAQVHDGYFVEPPSQYLVRNPFKYRVKGWIKDGQIIDLGGRKVRLLSTPGHTPDSVSVVDGDGSRLFTGDIVNRIITLVGVPRSDINAMAASLKRLQNFGRDGTIVYEAHAEAPITWTEFKQVVHGVGEIAAGRAESSPSCLGNTPMRRYMVGAFPFVLAMPGGPDQPPLGSVTETLDWDAGPCK